MHDKWLSVTVRAPVAALAAHIERQQMGIKAGASRSVYSGQGSNQEGNPGLLGSLNGSVGRRCREPFEAARVVSSVELRYRTPFFKQIFDKVAE